MIRHLPDLISDDPAALALITSHLAATRRQARYWQTVYPHDDVEPAVMQALYLAAFTFRIGKGSFYWWFRRKLQGQLANFRRNIRRHPRRVPYSVGLVDARFHYR